ALITSTRRRCTIFRQTMVLLLEYTRQSFFFFKQKTAYEINEMYKAKTGRDLDDTSARNMQSFFALVEAIDRAGSTEPEKIQRALQETDLKPEQLMMGYRGVKFDASGQNVLASTYLIQLKGKAYQLVWPQAVAASKLEWPMKGWKP